MPNETQIVATILHRNHKSIVVQMEKQLGCGTVAVAPEVERVYRNYLESVAKLEKQLGKEKAAPG
jgi:hypothetical protein